MRGRARYPAPFLAPHEPDGDAVTVLDPVWSGNRFTHGHGYLVFDTLYGLDERFTGACARGPDT